MRIGFRTTAVLALAQCAFGLAGCGSPASSPTDPAKAGAPSQASSTAGASLPDPAATATMPAASGSRAAEGDIYATIQRLAASREFAGGNSRHDIDAAAAAFAAEGLTFSGPRIAARLSADCSPIDVDAVGAILETELVLAPRPYPFSTNGYPACSLLSRRDPGVLMFTVFLSPDLNGRDNWSDLGTLDGSLPIPGVGDSAEWSDGSRSTNRSNPMFLQLFVTEAGTQSLIQASNSESQLRHIRSWTVPRLILALAQITADMSR